MIAFDVDLAAVYPPALVAAGNWQVGRAIGFGLREAEDPWRRMVEEVSVGEATYRFRYPIIVTFYPFVSDNEGELVQEDGRDGLTLGIMGSGRTFEEAYLNWSERLHAQVQDLLAKRSWELTEEEAEEMAAVERLIDLPAYHRETPYRVRQIGEVARRRPIPDRIRWEDGQLDHVFLAQMPPEFAALHAGQRFEAIVLRAAGSGALIRVVFVSPLPPLHDSWPSLEEWESVPKSSAAPKVSWDELK